MIGALVRRLLEVFRDAFRLWWLAPLIPLIAAVPEMVQHVVEIDLGMFASRDAARALGNDPTRWAFGYAKLAGYVVAILCAIRFWAARRQGLSWYSGKGIAWRVFAIGLAANVASALVGQGIEAAIGGASQAVTTAITLVYSLITLPLLVLLVAGLVGDREATLVSVYRTGWLAALRIVVFSAAVLVPLTWLHGFNHRLALGAEPMVVWSLMVFDSLVVGLLAAAWGTAIEHGYRPLHKDDDARSAPVSAVAA